MNKADKFLIRHEIDDVLPLIIKLQNILDDDLRVSQVVANTRQIGLQLVETIGLPLDNVVSITAVDVLHGLWKLGPQDCSLVSCRDTYGLEDLLHQVRHLIAPEMDPDVVLGDDVRDGYANGYYL